MDIYFYMMYEVKQEGHRNKYQPKMNTEHGEPRIQHADTDDERSVHIIFENITHNVM